MKRIITVLLLTGVFLALGAGTAFAVTLVGTAGPDRLHGTARSDRIEGRGGNDIITGGPGEDRIFAGAGDDFVSVGYEDDGMTPDRVDSGPGRDTIKLTMLKIVQRDVYVECERAVYRQPATASQPWPGWEIRITPEKGRIVSLCVSGGSPKQSKIDSPEAPEGESRLW